MPVIWKRKNITSFVSDVWMTVSTPKRYTNPFQHKIQNYWRVVKSDATEMSMIASIILNVGGLF
jgi:hypothetical protein